MVKRILAISVLMFFFNASASAESATDIISGQNSTDSSSINIISTGGTSQGTSSDTTGLFNQTDTLRQMQLLQGYGAEEQLKTFDGTLDSFKGLSDAEKIMYFNQLGADDQVRYFEGLSDENQLSFFKRLDTSEQVSIFKRLDKNEQAKLFDSLNQYEQAEILDSLTRQDDVSEIENILSGQFPSDIEKRLSQYGYNFFSKDSPTFEPLINVPVGSDYIIGPGDAFTIYLWGGAEENYNLTVSRDGNIIIPRIGTVNVSGLTFMELKEFLGNKFREYYNEFQINITMDTLRTIEIFLVGEVKNPGTYSVSSLSTIVSALYATGGPTKNGSLRTINLIRDGKTITTLDLYDFFIRGIKDNDARLEPGDTIFIPVIAPVAGISGYVKRPAIYELKGDQTIGDLIDLAGGVLSVSYLQNVVVERITDHQKRVVKTFNLDTNNKETNDDLNTVLQDGDLIKIYPVNETMHQVVYLEGHVKYPRAYEFREGIKILDIIPSYDYLLNEPYLPLAEVVRLVPPDLHPETVKFNLDALLSGDETQNLALQDQDRIIIYGKWDKKDRPKVSINGEVKNPGTYNLVENMTVKDLIFLAGNLSDRAFLDNADLTRFIEGKDDTQSLTMKFSVRNALDGAPEDNILLEADDIIYIRSIPSYAQALNRKVYLDGEFLFPGEYSFSEGERLSSVILRAGGLTESAYPFGAIFQRESVKEVLNTSYQEYISQLEKDVANLTAMISSNTLDKEDLASVQTTLTEKKELLARLKETKPTGRMLINLEKVLVSPSSAYDVKLRAGDRLIVSKRQDYINITGEVYNAAALLYEEGKDVDYYLNKVGGVTKSAAKRQIYIVKANGTVISRQQGGLLGLGLWDGGNSRWSFGGFGSIELDPGDSIIVPQKTVKIDWFKGISNVTSIIYQLAVAAAVIQDYVQD